MRLSRIKWKKLFIVAIVTGAAVCAAVNFDRADTEVITYTKEVVAGDTLWGIVSKVATDKEDVCKLTWQVMQDNHIENPGDLQPGTVIVIHVKKAREL